MTGVVVLRPTPPPRDGLPGSILLIEPNDCERELLCDLLVSVGVDGTHVCCVASVAEARRQLIERPFDCVLIDASPPPQGDGIEAVAIMRASARDTAVVVLTGDRSSGSVHVAMAEGADDFLPKGDLGEERVREVLTGVMARRAARIAENPENLGLVEALDSVDSAAVVIDGTGVIIATNQAWRSFAATNDGSATRIGVGVNYLAVCDRAAGAFSDGAAEAARGLRAVLEGDQSSFVHDYPCPSGDRERWFSLRVTPAGDLGGGALVVHIDITDVVLAERRIQREDLRPHHVLDREAPILVLVGADGAIREISDSTRQIFGVDEAMLVGDVALDWIEHDDADVVSSTFLEVLAEPGATRRAVVKALGVDQRWHDLDLTFTNLLDDPRIAAVVVAGAEVTDARNRQIQEVLNQRLLQRLPAAVIVTDDRHIVVSWNDRAAQLYGYSPAEAIGRPIGELNVGPTGQAEAERIMAHVQRTGRWEGAYEARRADGSTVPVHVQLDRVEADDIDFRGTVGASIDISERRELEAHLEFQALHDPLTGLPNRRHFVTALQQALETPDGLTAVLFVDLDDFATINERVGHLGGDQVVCRVGDAIVAALRSEDTVARIGGDEFVVCCPGLDGVAAATTVGERILSALAQPMEVAGQRLQVSASIGLARATDGIGPEGLMRNADVAMYRAKESGKGRLALFDDVLQRKIRDRQETVRQLEVGLQRDEVEAHFQPQFDLSNGDLVGFEALARWRHPDRGVIGPADFVPVAEDASLIGALGRKIFLDACTALATWRELAPGCPTVSVNVAVEQLLDPAFPDWVRATIEDAALPPSHVCLEVTESSLADPVLAEAALRRLKAVGVEIAIDDFGTGYSSFSRLHRFPVDYVKIDRSFVRAMDDANGVAIVSAVLELSRALGFRCIAEGVETAEQRAKLAAMGWDIAQGYLWSPAVVLDEATQMVRRSSTAAAVPAAGRR